MLLQRAPEVVDGRGGNAESNKSTDSKVLQSVYNMDKGLFAIALFTIRYSKY